MCGTLPFIPISNRRELKNGHKRSGTFVYRLLIPVLALLCFIGLAFVALESVGDHEAVQAILDAGEDVTEIEVSTDAQTMAIFCLNVKKGLKVYVCVDMYGVNVSAGGINKLAVGPAKGIINSALPPEIFDRFADVFRTFCLYCGLSVICLSGMMISAVLAMKCRGHDGLVFPLRVLCVLMGGVLQVSAVLVGIIVVFGVVAVIVVQYIGVPGINAYNCTLQAGWGILFVCFVALTVTSYMHGYVWRTKVYILPVAPCYRRWSKEMQRVYDAEQGCGKGCCCRHHGSPRESISSMD